MTQEEKRISQERDELEAEKKKIKGNLKLSLLKRKEELARVEN